MPLLSNPSFGPRTALVYITVGALLDAWTTVWYFWFARDQEGHISRNTWFWLTGLFLTGLIFMLIGFYLGRIGRAARKAELPPKEVEPQEAAIQQTAAAVPHPMMPGAAMPAVAPMAGVMPGMMAAGGAPVAPAQPVQPAQPSGQFVPGVTKR
jgi:hypothetical protein